MLFILNPWSIIFMVCFAFFFYKAAEMDDKSPMPWVLMSITIWWLYPGFSGQIGLFLAIAIYRVLADTIKHKR